MITCRLAFASLIGVLISFPGKADCIPGTSWEQPAAPNVEASNITQVTCSGPGFDGHTYYLYHYTDRDGFRAILPPNWGAALGGRDYSTRAAALDAIKKAARAAPQECNTDNCAPPRICILGVCSDAP